MSDEGLHFKITADNANFLKKLKEAESGVKATAKQIEESGSSIEDMFERIQKAAALSFAGFTATEFVKKVASVRGEFQKLEVAFKTMLGSEEKASDLMAQLVHTAAITPFDLKGVSEGAKQLLAYGEDVSNVNDDLIRLGNIAAGLSQPLGDIVYLYGTTMTQGRLYTQDLNQFTGRGIPMIRELAKQFGVAESEVKDLVQAGKVGFPEVQKVIQSLTNEGGMFFNLMQEQSKTISGQISNIEDAIDTMLNDIGKQSEGIINTALSVTASLVENYKQVGEAIMVAVTAFGTYKAILMTVAAYQKAYNMVVVQAAVEMKLAAAAGVTLSEAQAMAAARTKLLTLAQQGLIKSLKAVAAATLANPYVLATAAITGMVYGIYKLKTAETEAEKVTRKYNEAKEKAAQAEEEHKQKIQDLLDVAEDEAAATLDRNNAIELLKKAYPGIIDKYIDEKGHLKDILKLKKDIAEYDSKVKVQDNKTALESINKKVEEQLAYVTAMSGSSDAVKEASKTLEALQAQQREAQKAVNADYLNARLGEAQKMSDAELKKTINQYRSTLGKVEGDQIGDFSRSEIEAFIQSLETLQSSREGATKNKKYWEDKKKEAEDAREALDVSKKNTAEWNKYTKQIEEAQKQIDKYNTPKASEAAKRKEEQEKLNEDLLSLQRDNQEAELSLMKDGSEKQLKQIELDYNNRKAAIDKQAKDMAKSNKKAGATGLNKNGLTSEQQEAINKAYDLSVQQMDKSIADLYKAPLQEYQSYADERLKIEKKYNDDIALLRKAREQAEAKGNKDDVAKIDRSIAKATSEKGKALMKQDFDVLKQSPEYIRAFEDLRNTSTETLDSLLAQLEQAKTTAATVLNPEDLREYTTTIQEIMDELDSRNPFKALANAQQELAKAQKALAVAERQLQSVQNGGKIVTGSKMVDGKIVNTYLTAAEAAERYREAKDSVTKANNKFQKAENTAKSKVDELAEAISGVGNAIGGQAGDIISLIGDIVLFTTNTIDSVKLAATAGANALSTVEKASVILTIVQAAIQVMQKLNDLFGGDKAFKQYEAYAQKVSEIEKLTNAVNDYRIAAIEAQQAEKNWFSSDNLQSLRDYKEVHDAVTKAYKDAITAQQATYQNEKGGGWFTGTFKMIGKLVGATILSDALGWTNKGYDASLSDAIDNLRIETRKKSNGFLGTGIGKKDQKTEDLRTWARNNGYGELFDEGNLINTTVAQNIIDNYGDKLVGQTKETLETLIDLREQYDEYLEQLHEYVSSLYEPLVDNFVDSLWDWLDEGKDALDSFREYASDTFRDIVSDMLRTIVLDKVVGTFSDDIAEIYEDYASGKIDESKLMQEVAERTGQLVNNYEKNVPTLQNVMNQVQSYLQAAGIDLKDSSTATQSASTGGWEAMGQDTAQELNGRLTALQIAGENVSQQMLAVALSVSTIVTITTEGNTALNNILNQHVITNSYLEEVVKYTKLLNDIKSDIYTMKRDGITTK